MTLETWQMTAYTCLKENEVIKGAVVISSKDIQRDLSNFYNVELMIGSSNGGLDRIGQFRGDKHVVQPNNNFPMCGYKTFRRLNSGQTVVLKITRYGKPKVPANSYTVQLTLGLYSPTSQNERPGVSIISRTAQRNQNSSSVSESIEDAINKNSIGDWTVSIPLQDPLGEYIEVGDDGYPKMTEIASGTPTSSTVLLGNGTWGPAPSPWTYVVLANDFSTTNSANTNVTNFSFTPASSKKYIIEMFFLLRSPNNIAVGPRPGITWPTAGISDNAATLSAADSATTTVFRHWGQPNTQNTAVTAVLSSTYSYPAWGTAILIMTTGATGAFQITLASETNGTSVTMKANSYFRYREFP